MWFQLKYTAFTEIMLLMQKNMYSAFLALSGGTFADTAKRLSDSNVFWMPKRGKDGKHGNQENAKFHDT